MKKVFIDGGARVGEVFDIIHRDMPQYIDFDFVLYEPHPNHIEHLTNLSNEKKFTYINGAIWDKTGLFDFFLSVDIYGDQGSTLCSDKKEKLNLETPVKVQTYDIVDILNKYEKDDYIVLKLDVEGAEYDIIQRLIDTNNIHKVKEYIIEWHDSFFEGKRKPRWDYITEINKYSIHIDWTY